MQERKQDRTEEKIGFTAGEIWHALNARGEMPLAKLKKQVQGAGPLFDWAVGWLAREDKLVITPDRRSFRLRLKGAPVKPLAS